MFDVGWPELLVIAIVLIVVVGPQDLPRMLRAFGKATAKMRTMAGEFRTQFDEALKEADLDDVRKTISDAQNLNPTKSLRDAMNPLRQVGEDIRSGLNDAIKPGSLTKPDKTEAAESPVKQSADIGKPAAALNGSGTANGEAASEPVSKPRKTARAKAASTAKANGKAVAAKGNGKTPKSAGTRNTSKSASTSRSTKATLPKPAGEAAPAASKAPTARARKTSTAQPAPVKKAASRKTARKSGDEADT